MGVTDGQPVNAATTNPAFLDANNDDTAIGKINLANISDPTVSGPTVMNAQREHNAVASFLGKPTGQAYDVLPAWVYNYVGNPADNVFQRADALTERFSGTSGHSHTGLDGDGPLLSGANIGDVPLLGFFIEGVDLTGVSGGTHDVSTELTGKTPSNGPTETGVVVNTPYNKVVLRDSNGDEFVNGSGDVIYGRVTESVGVWTLTFYYLNGATETAYSFPAPVTVKWYYQELYNPIVASPVYSPLAFIPSDNTTADVVDASETVAGKIMLANTAPPSVSTVNVKGTSLRAAHADHTHAGASNALDNLSTTNIGTHLLFNADNMFDVGSLTNLIRTLFTHEISSSGSQLDVTGFNFDFETTSQIGQPSGGIRWATGDSDVTSGGFIMSIGNAPTQQDRGDFSWDGRRIVVQTGFWNGWNETLDPTDPTPIAGDMYYNTTSNKYRFYDGTVWADVGSGGGGANTALSNLIATSINQDLIGNTGATWYLQTMDNSIATQMIIVQSGDVVSGTADAGAALYLGGNAFGGNGGDVTSYGGDSTDVAGTGNGGGGSFGGGNAFGNGNGGSANLIGGLADGSGIGGYAAVQGGGYNSNTQFAPVFLMSTEGVRLHNFGNGSFVVPLQFYDVDNSNYVGFKAATVIPSDVTWELPSADATTPVSAMVSNAAGILSFAPLYVWQNGNTAGRPATPVLGEVYFDTTLGIPIWYNSTDWVDATGTVV